MKSNKNTSALNSSAIYNKLSILVIVVSFALIASMLWARSHAATPVVSAEAENGTITSPATSLADSTASGSSAVKFTSAVTPPPPPPTPGGVSSTTPCVGSAAPAQWKHVVVLMFENKTYSSVIGSSSAPWITSMSKACGTYTAWKDSNYKVDGSTDGSYVSKPSYATLTSGVSPSVSGLTGDGYSSTSSVDNIFNRLNQAGKMTKSYQSGSAGSCATSNFNGAYHDAMRYYTNLGGQSSSPTTYCNTHDVTIGSFMTDVNSGNLPAFSLVIPTNDQNMHDVSVSVGDAWAKSFLVPFLDSAQYKSGDTALFFLWDEDTPIPNVLMAPSIKPGSKPVPSGSLTFSHFSATRTWQEMLGLPVTLGVSAQAPSLLNYYNGN